MATIRSNLHAALHPAPDRDPSAPPDANDAIAAALGETIAHWAPFADLSASNLVELDLLLSVLRAGPAEAGSLAQECRHPGAVLAIRDVVQDHAKRHAAFDRQRAALDATRRLWFEQQEGRMTCRGLLDRVQALGTADIDLFHRIVLDHDRTDPDQRAAALWCVSQPGCDRATVASFFADLGVSGGLQAAALRGDQAYLDAVRGVLDNWNAGIYTVQDLRLDPIDAICGQQGHLSQSFDALAEIQNAPCWPDPAGLFTEYPGRPPRHRSAWDLREGSLLEPPSRAEYLPLSA